MKKRGIIVAMVVVIVSILSYGAIFALNGLTLISFWIPLAVAVFLATASGLALWRVWARITRRSGLALNMLLNTLVLTGPLLALFYIINYACADNRTDHTEQVVVERLYSKTRHHTRRISRRHYTQGEAYKVYYTDIRFADGRQKSFSIPYSKYSRLRSGDTLSLGLYRGGFGVPVIKQEDLRPDVHRSSRRY